MDHKNCPGCGALIALWYSACAACRAKRVTLDVLGYWMTQGGR